MGCVNNYYLVVIKVVVRQACSGDDLTSLPKNKAAFSLSSHLGLDWSFRTTASPVIVHRHLRVRGTSRGSSRVISTSSFDVSVHLDIVFVEPNDPSYFEHSSRFISTSRSIPRSISTFGPRFEPIRVSAHARTRSASVRSSDATRFSNNQSGTGCSPTANQLKRLHQVQEAAQTMLQLPRQPNQPEK